MARTRKTKDVFVVQVNYGLGWQDECEEDSWKATREQLKTYRANIDYPVRYVKRREKINESGSEIPSAE